MNKVTMGEVYVWDGAGALIKGEVLAEKKNSRLVLFHNEINAKWIPFVELEDISEQKNDNEHSKKLLSIQIDERKAIAPKYQCFDSAEQAMFAKYKEDKLLFVKNKEVIVADYENIYKETKENL